MESREQALKGLENWINCLENDHFFEGENQMEILDQLRLLTEKLKKKLTILISGEFNAGKSTFINAVLGEKVLVSDVTPATAMITKLTYNEEKKLLLHFKNKTIEEYGFFSLKQISAEGDNYGDEIRKDLEFIEIQLPVQLLKYYTLIDSPGLTSLHQKHSDVTDQFMNEADVAIWLFNSLNVGTATEMNWLQKLTDHDIPVFGLVNGIDRLDEDEDLEVFYEYNLRRLAPLIKKLDGISSRDILEGKLNDDIRLKEWGKSEVIDNLFGSFESEKLDAFFSLVEKPLNDLQNLLMKDKNKSILLLKREKLIQVFEKIDSETQITSEKLEAAYQKKEKIIREWQMFLQNNLLEPTNIDPFISQFKNAAKLKVEWDSLVWPQLRNYFKEFENLQLERKLLDLKKLAAEEHYIYIDDVYFKFLQTAKYMKAERDYNANAKDLNEKFKKLNLEQKNVGNSIQKFIGILEKEIKNEISPINEEISLLTAHWRNHLLPVKQLIGNWEIEDLHKMEEYALKVRDLQHQVLPYLYLSHNQHSLKVQNGEVLTFLSSLSRLYRKIDKTEVINRIRKVSYLKDPAEKFAIKTFKQANQTVLQSIVTPPTYLDLKKKLLNVSPQLVKDPAVVAAAVALVMIIF